MILGIDIGGTKSAVALGQPDGSLIARDSRPTDREAGWEPNLKALAEMAKGLLAERQITLDQITGIGVSCGGPLDTRTGIIYSPPNLPGWDEVPAKEWFGRAFSGIPVVVENDANATALAEWRFGAGRGVQNMIFLTMGTGIGGGLILDGRLYRGTNDLAGEVGHQTILINGPLCECGKRGCLEALASGPAIARLARESMQFGRGKLLVELAGSASAITAQHVVEAAKRGDPLSRAALEEAGTYMGVGLANLIQILNPECIALGTIAVHAGDLILGPIRKAVAEYAWDRSQAVCRIVPAELGDRAQDLAALSLVAVQA